MDRNVFDTAVRGFASRTSRRAAVKGLAAAALGLGVVREAGAQPGAQLAACENRCNADADCNAGLRCGMGSRRCFAMPDSRLRCSANIQCPSNWEICNRNDRCINQTRRCPQCERNGDCPAGEKCRNGNCEAPQCTRNSDCPRREKCRRGRCVDRN